MSEEKRVQGARDIALDALMQVERANAWSDEGLRRGITRGGLDSRDAALAARIAYGVMQNRMLLDFYIAISCAWARTRSCFWIRCRSTRRSARPSR